ncbi:hypothetical protein [Antribacter gilvus]|uniref:hypothetical protein n=1 Tax=Antribacter gilvus TaxID=2304675 RepID=UPI000F777FBB|nr:hypothetical protein [Antribacter gilvus]
MKTLRAARAGGVVVGALLVSSLVALPAAEAATPPGSWYYLTNGTAGGSADIAFAYGKADDTVLVGDWDKDGTDTLGVRRAQMYYLTNGTTGGAADITFAYGKPDDVVLVGDWDGDGTDTLGVRRGNSYFLTNGTTGGAADITFAYGRADDVVLVGDWDGDGTDTLGVRRSSAYYLTNGTTGGAADITFAYGRANDVVLIGDWNADGTDTLGVRRSSAYYLTNGTTGGSADIAFAYGRGDDVVLIGDWNGDGSDTLGVRRQNGPATIPWSQYPTWYTVGSNHSPGYPHLPTGLYRASVTFTYCYWEAQDLNDVMVGRGAGPGPAYMELTSKVAWVYVDPGCGYYDGWRTAFPGDVPNLDLPFTGQYRVNIDVAPGLYRGVPTDGDTTDELDACWVGFLKDFTGADGSYVGAELPYGQEVIVEIPADYTGFETFYCNTGWEPYVPQDGLKFEAVSPWTIGAPGISSATERPAAATRTPASRP